MDEFAREQTRERLGYLDALAAAQERRNEVMAIIESSEDEAEAVQGLVTLLALDNKTHALVVIDMQVRRWTKQDRLRLAAEREELRAALSTP